MSGVYVGKTKNLGKLGEGVMRRKSAWLPEELMQAISIAQTVIKPRKHDDYWMESATKLLAGSILYLDQKHKNLYYLDVKKVIEFTGKIYESEANLVEVIRSLENEHPAYQIFHELGLYSAETRDAIIITLLYILEKHQREKQGEQKEYFWFE
ncbi:TRAG family protein [Bacillus pseudomycoides]|uniref:TRAG family protein n=1 Tax=Bacillus pseudomycoides TaxID=64104 RepID=UPI000BEC426A|nr:TRAG family protein [Bacillus pseudomycoides]MED4654527.1 TRAG family protein [Bacillus pseudomycoides]PEE06087.1 TRAG family protein [Bacillus pseudomycoides]PEM79720.1 TRAG family protein [Bacillus pseudomycoides]PHC84414.1 TRAG family protein [Bacillus pseudomycoides]